METLWAPWRMDYILSEKDDACVFCTRAGKNEDRESLIIYRGEHCFVILNRYPYNNGHLMIAPYRHVADLTLMNEKELLEMMTLSQKAIKIFKSTINPGGFNMGINLGSVGGAGIKDHLHLHIVPRWFGDTNFMPVIGCTKVIPQHLQDMYRILKEAWTGEIE